MKIIKLSVIISVSLIIQDTSFANSNKKIDELIQSFIKENKVGGISVAVLSNEEKHIFNYGFVDDLKKVPITSNTIYTIASFTKTFTGTLGAIAAVDKKLDLDSPFIKYFPEIINNSNLKKITTRELLAHVSSFPFDFEPRPKTYKEIVNALNQFEGKNNPGSEYSYSNAGIGTVGFILQNIYSKSYQEILNDKILKPLNMDSTYLNVPVEKEKYITVGHDKNNIPVPYNKEIEAWFAAASLKSTITDMSKYLNAHINYLNIKDPNLSQAILLAHENKYCFEDKISCEQLSWQSHTISELKNSIGDTYFYKFNKDGTPLFYSKKINKNINFESNKIFIDKSGSGYGMSSYMAYIPNKKKGVVILINKSIGDSRIKLGRDILSNL